MGALLRTRARVSLAASAAPVAARLGAGGGGRARALLGQLRLPRPELAAGMALAAALNLWALAQNGWGNPDYSAARRPMSSGWPNFLFASPAPRGGVTGGQPPPAPGVQGASGRPV